jgi:uncharacterized protein YbjT (DUF2867 family)
METKKTALVVGATGLVGSELLSLLLKDDYYSKVKAVVRREVEIQDAKLEIIITDFKDMNRLGDKLAADHIYCCLGTTMKKAGSKDAFYKVDFHFPLEIAKLCQSYGAKQFFLVSAMGANIASKIFYNRVKGEIEVAISSVPFQGVNIFRPSLILGDRNEKRFGEKIAAIFSKILSPFFIGPLKKYKPIQASAVAEGMFKIAKQELNGFYIFESDQMVKI